MKEEIKILIYCDNSYIISDKLKEFMTVCNFSLIDKVYNMEDLFIRVEQDRPKGIIVIKDKIDDLLKDTLKIIKSSFVEICIATFSNTCFSVPYIDYSYFIKDVDVQLYNVFLRIKHPFGNDTCNGFFVSPQRITEVLDILEVKKRFKGYGYLKDAIEIISRDKNKYGANMMKVYRAVGERRNVSSGSVERCIRIALNQSSLDLDYRKLENTKYYNLAEAMDKSSNSEFIRSFILFLAEELYA